MFVHDADASRAGEKLIEARCMACFNLVCHDLLMQITWRRQSGRCAHELSSPLGDSLSLDPGILGLQAQLKEARWL